MAKFPEIKKYLESKGIQFKVINLPRVAVSVDDVIRLSGGQIKEEEIIKTLIVKTKSDEFAGCVLRGRERIKDGFITRLATREEVFKIAGVDFGAVCPILLGIPIIINSKVTHLKRVNMGSGDHLKGLELRLKDLLKLLPNYTIKEIA